ncbi:MAG: cardiolipin synthase [Bacteroidaceae bacterium]|nr:cardiolipin synthase [Bacteroidaceae bacterium]
MVIWEMFDNLVSTVVSSLFLLTVVITIVVVILDNRNPVKTLAWVLVLSFLPVIGLIFYFFFGRDVRREKLISKRGYFRLTKYPLAEYYEQKSSEYTDDQHPLKRFFRKVNEALPFDGNSVQVYTSGHEMLQSLLQAIANAKHHIHLQFYIFEDDAVGRLVRDALIEKVREGVEVRLLYDDVGCWKVDQSFYEKMREAGIETRGFLKVRFPMFTSKVNYRNHRKVVVIDGRVGFVGGMNLALRYLKGVKWGIWRDTHTRIEGRAVYGLQIAFLSDWYAADHSLITSSRYYPDMPVCGESSIQIVTSNPIGGVETIMQGLLIAITGSQKYFYIQTPYLLPTEPILLALRTAALGGVDVRIMIPERADSRITHLASLSYLDELMQSGVKIYRYNKGFLHSKVMVSDDVLSTVGSTNMDFRSFEHNFEVNAFMYDRESALKMKSIFLDDQKDADLVQLKEWRMRPWYQKVAESVIRLFAPLL